MRTAPDSEKTARALRHATAVSDWEHRAGRALWRQSEPARIEAALLRWIAKGRREIGRNLPLMTVIGYAHSRLPGDRMDDPSALRITAMHRFAAGLRHDGFRIHHSYLDRLLQARRGGINYQAEIEAGAFRIAEARGWEISPAEAYHESLLAYLEKAGVGTARRRLLTSEDAEDYGRKRMNDLNGEFARQSGARVSQRR